MVDTYTFKTPAAKEKELKPPSLQFQRFFAFCCNVCKVTSAEKPLQMCSRCKACWYCSREHQKLDLKNHKHGCKALASLRVSDGQPDEPTDEESRTLYHTQQLQLFSRALGRSPHRYEQELLMYERRCNFCFKRSNSVVPCQTCFSVAYCCEQHRDQDMKHSQVVCQQLAVGLACYQEIAGLAIHTKNSSDGPAVWIPRGLTKNYLPLECATNANGRASGWRSYFERRQKPDAPGHVDVMFADMLSPVLTSLYAAQLALTDLASLESLTLHFVGASTDAQYAITKFEEILHMLPNLMTLNIVLCGNELSKTEHLKTTDTFHVPIGGGKTAEQKLLCKACQEKGRILKITTYSGPYHQFAAESIYEIPTIALACNCGVAKAAKPPNELQESNHCNWEQTLKQLRGANIPAVFTSRNEREAAEDLDVIKGAGMKVLIELQENPFFGIRPFQDGLCHNEVSMNNSHIIVVQGPS